MSNVLVEKNKLDILANAISNKSGEPLTLTLDEMVEAVDGIDQGITPTGNIDITQAGVTDVTNYATATVPSAEMYEYDYLGIFSTVGGTRRWTVGFEGSYGNGGWIQGIVEADGKRYSAVPQNTTITPTESSQTIGGANYMMEGAVTVNAIPSNYVGSGITRRSSTDLTVSGATVTAPSGYYSASASKSVASGTAGTPTATKGTVSNHSVSVTPSVTNTTGYITGGTINGTAVSVSASELVSGTLNVTSAGTKDVTNYASASIPSGTEGTPTATKGTVSNHSVSVTPSVTNTNGFISGGTKTGTAVTVSASELVSGSETKTANGTYDVTNLAELVVDVSGGGSSTIQVGKTTKTLSATASSIQFTGLSGNPTSFVITSSADIATNTDGVTAVVYDGTSLHGQTMTTQVTADTGFTKSYSSGTLTVTATTAEFQANEYKLVYTYNGSSSDIHTSDVQVGSGATSITFSSLAGRPIYWSCIFKSDFSTSSGYQRVISVANDGTSIYGMAMDSSAKAQTSWTATYSGGNLTISSSGTNNGGYFHQPGYYQLTYIVDDSAPSYQTKTVTPTTSQQVVTADTGYDALSQVTVNAIPSQYIIPTGNLAITQNGNNINVAQYATVSVTVSGGGTSTCDTKTMTNSDDQATSIQFTGLSGQPKWFFVRCTSQLTRSSSYSYYYVTAVRYNGTNHNGNYWRRSNGTFYNDTTHYSHTYSNGTLTVSSSAGRGSAGGSFYNGGYELVYIY